MSESNVKLSEELKELTGWEYDQVQGYSLGFLMRKLPPYYVARTNQLHVGCWGSRYRAGYMKVARTAWHDMRADDDSPENALCRLAIKLAKAGIIGKDDK